MNTKGTRFLAVVAVMALAFTLFVALDPADENMAVDVYQFDDDNINPDKVTAEDWTYTKGEAYAYYISEDTTVKMKGQDSDVPATGYKFYVQNGVALTLDFKNSWTTSDTGATVTTTKVTIVTVTGDQEYKTVQAEAGKIQLAATQVKITPVQGMSVYYKGAVVDYEPGFSRTTSNVGDFDYSETPEIKTKAQFSADKEFTVAPVIEVEVAVAPGQTIESYAAIENTNFEWGACVKDVTDSNTTNNTLYTFYSIGANVGDFTFNSDNEEIKVIDGKVNAKLGSGNVKVDKTKENKYDLTTTVIKPSGDNIVIGGGDINEDQMAAGEITVNGNSTNKIKFNNFYFSDGTVSVSNKTVFVENENNVCVDGTLILKNENATSLNVSGEGTVCANNTELWEPTPTDGLEIGLTNFDGLIDTSSITKVLRMEKDVASSTIEINQTFELFGNTTVSTELSVKGILIVDEGVTLTVDKGAKISMDDSTNTVGKHYAQIINYGTIVVKAETFEDGLFINTGKLFNYGTISMASKSNLGDATTATIYSSGLGIKNFGTITISKPDYAELIKFENTATGKLTVNGTFWNDSTIKNKGSIVFNGANLTTDGVTVTVDNKGMGASFYISSAKLGGETNYILVQDTNLSYYDDENAIHKGNSMAFIGFTTSNITESTIRGLTVSASLDDDDNPQMVLGGGVTVSCDKKQVDIVLLNAGKTDTTVDVQGTSGVVQWTTTEVCSSGNFAVNSTLSIPAYVKLSTGLAAYNAGVFAGMADDPTTSHVKITVNGEMSFNKDAIEKQTGDNYAVTDLYVYGEIVTKEADKLSFAHFVGAKAENNDGDMLYAPIEDVLAYSILNDINTIDVGYVATAADDADYPVITTDITIPSEVNIQTVERYAYVGTDSTAELIDAKI